MAYESGWTSIIELQNGDVVADKLNSAFTNIDLGLAQIEGMELDISGLTTITSDHEIRITALEVPADKTFTYSANDGMTVDNEAYDDAIGVEHIFSAPIGDVMYGYSVTFSGTVNDKLWIEFTVPNEDGTAGIPFEHVFEIKDSSEVRPKYYAFPRTHTASITDGTVRVRFRKDTGDADFTVNFVDVMSEVKN